MMKTYIKLLIVFLSLGFFMTSCDPKDNGPDYEIIDVTENITSNTNWGSGKIYVIKKYDFEVNSELTIGAGTIIKFTTNAGNITVNSGGKIIAHGSASEPIVFTSIKDDDHGGDTNGDGGVTVPVAGDWSSITLDGSNGSEFVYCHFLYGGKYDGVKQNVTLDIARGSRALINSCTFAYNGGGHRNSYYFGALHAEKANSATQITNNLFYSNELPMVINSEISIDNSNTFSYSGKTNKFNGIFTSGDITKNTSWLEDEVAFVVTIQITNISNKASLTLGDNVVLKFDDITLNLVWGEDALKNHDGRNVWFTSLKDDTLKGDTNGDGAATSPQEKDWVGIFIDNWAGKADVGYADWANIKYNDPNPPVK